MPGILGGGTRRRRGYSTSMLNKKKRMKANMQAQSSFSSLKGIAVNI